MIRLAAFAVLHILWLSDSVSFVCATYIPDINHIVRAEDQVVLGHPHAVNNRHGEPYRPFFPHKPKRPSTGFIALGDSYSAGIGTGLHANDTEDDCRHGSSAYPTLIQADLTAQEGENHTSFQHLSCTGSTIEDVLSGGTRSQIDDFNTTSTADFALLSIGGNDLGFFEIMNSCIFRFYSFYSGTCETALQKSEEQLKSPDFEHRLRIAIMEVLDRVRWEKKPWFTITVTGYARFFNADTEECDNCSFGVWWKGPKLTQDLRKRMNNMVLSVNDKIRTSVAAINARFTKPRVFFVDYDDAFEGHRFCERNVTEPDYTRNETWFFLVGGRDNIEGSVDDPPQPQPPPNASALLRLTQLLDPSSPLINPDSCMNAARDRGDWGELALCMMVRAARDDVSLRRAHDGELMAQNSMWYVPTYYGKTFHPRTLGHMAIRDRIYELWEMLEEQRRLDKA